MLPIMTFETRLSEIIKQRFVLHVTDVCLFNYFFDDKTHAFNSDFDLFTLKTTETINSIA